MRLHNLAASSLTNQRFELRAIGDGIIGLRDTLRAMAQLAREAQGNPLIVHEAHAITAGCGRGASLCNLQAVQNYVRATIRYVPDPRDLEAIKSPDVLLQSRSGDCDDQAVLVAALLLALGITPRFVAAATSESRAFDHVYAEALVPGAGWVSLETTEPVPLGWRPLMFAPPLLQAV